MYEHVTSLYSWAVSGTTQEIIGILVMCLAVLIPVAYAVLAFTDVVLGYALSYIHEDNKERRVIKDTLSYTTNEPFDVAIKRVLGDIGRTWIRKYSTIGDKLRSILTEDEIKKCTDSDGDFVTKHVLRLTRDTGVPIKYYLLDTILLLRTVIILPIVSLVLYFLPFWLLVTAGSIYGTLRTARFAVRYSKKFNTHLEKEHELSSGESK